MPFVKRQRVYWKYVTEAFNFVTSGTKSTKGWQSVTEGSNYLSGTSNAYEMGQNTNTELVWTYFGTLPASTYTFNVKTSGQGNGHFNNPTVTVTYNDNTTDTVYTKSWSGVTLNEDFTFVTSKPIKSIKASGYLTHSSTAYVVISLTLTSLTHIGSQETTSEDYDYYTYRDKLYNLATKKRTYYKYEYQDWTQPVATAATTAITGGNMVITASSTEGYRKIYGALDGSMSAAENAWLSNSSGAAWWQVKFPYKIKITGLTHYNPYVSASCAITSAQFFTSSSKTTPIGNSFSTPDTDWYKTVISGIPSEGIVTDTIYFSGVGGGYAGIGELVITAQKQLPAVETTEDEAEWYVDRLTAYTPAAKGLLTYRIYEKQRDTGTYTFTLYEDYEGKLLFVGNGGPGNSSQADSQWHYSGGGSGACFEGIVRLPADTYTLTIGTLGYGTNRDNTHYNSGGVASTDSYLTNSAGEELIRVGAGGKGYTSVGGVSGAAGVLKLGTLDVVETIKAVNGNTSGKTAATNFAVSAYDGTETGYGAGTGAERYQGNVYGIAGIFKLEIEYQAEGIRSY